MAVEERHDSFKLKRGRCARLHPLHVGHDVGQDRTVTRQGRPVDQRRRTFHENESSSFSEKTPDVLPGKRTRRPAAAAQGSSSGATIGLRAVAPFGQSMAPKVGGAVVERAAVRQL
ncbi:hypothetical protein MTO96_027805 [Rhipicephalus appendiculatus]